MIHFNFSFAYHDAAFKMSGHIHAKELIGLSGPSGAGKSTFLRLLAGLEKAQEGHLVVDDTIWFDTQQRIWLSPRMRPIGMVFQDGGLFPHMTVKEQILYADNRGDIKWINELIKTTGLAKLVNRYTYELSGGQKQRVALARALARKPKLLLLDEPLSALDQSSKEQLQYLLQCVHEKYLTYTILVSHNIAELLCLTHRVFKCKKGRITQCGIPYQMLLPNTSQFLSAQVLAKRYINHQWTLTLLVGQTIFNINVPAKKIKTLQERQIIRLCPKTFKVVVN